MKIQEATFFKSVFEPGQLPEPGVPEIAFAGRSNVGKSSLINTLLNRKGLAKTSSTPGRTQSINFIEVNKSFFFVDLPGYGYAKVPDTVKKKWRHLIDSYLTDRKALGLVILIIDARRDPMDPEAQFADWLQLQGTPCIAVLTKCDKLNRSTCRKSLDCWQKFLNVAMILPFSAVTGEGKTQLWKIINNYV